MFRTRRLAGAGALLLALGVATGAPAPAQRPEPPVPAALPGAEPFPLSLRARLAKALAARGPDHVPRTRQRRADGSPRFTNRLIFESSPYLQQHAHNPVNWYPWGDEAFEVARRLHRPVLVSIGYSTCHWCHVMEEESYDDPDTARLLNAHFVAIKVDREVRPDVDAVYMTALQALTGQGGWPLNVWMTPDREPFHGGTYFPPRDEAGRPAFRTVLKAIHEAWRNEPERVKGTAARLSTVVRERLSGATAAASRLPDAGALHTARAEVARRFDSSWGGVGRRPKFPATTPIRFLLRYQRRTGDAEARRMALLTLEKMAAGGLHDQLGGGFHRYATDRRWRVPHFEKMLYDNALRAIEYLEAWQATGRSDFADVVRRTLEYLRREMTAPHGGFFSATDADSLGPAGVAEEGRFFTWTAAEIRAALDPETARAALAWWSVTGPGELEGRHVLHVSRPLEDVARELELAPEVLADRIERAREHLWSARARRPPPHRDEKILAAWNGLAISAFARAGLALDEAAWVDTAARAADFVLTRMRVDGRLRRVFAEARASQAAFLEDHAFLIAGLLDLYEARPDPRWLREALALQAELDTRYADGEGGGYFRTAADHERLLAREKPGRDGALPSGNSVATMNLLRLYELTGEARHRAAAGAIFSFLHDPLTTAPLGVPELLLALDAQLDTIKEIVIVRSAGTGEGGALLDVVRRRFVPNRVLVRVAEGPDRDAHALLVPLATGKTARDGRTTAYVCEDRVCKRPTSEPEVLERQLARTRPLGGAP